MLILILVDVQYLRNVAFSIAKEWNGQNYFLSDSHNIPPRKKIRHQNLKSPNLAMGEIPLPLNAVWKTLIYGLNKGNYSSLIAAQLLLSSLWFY